MSTIFIDRLPRSTDKLSDHSTEKISKYQQMKKSKYHEHEKKMNDAMTVSNSNIGERERSRDATISFITPVRPKASTGNYISSHTSASVKKNS